MTALNKQALRQLATDAHELGIIKRYTKGIEANKRFVAIATPLTVLALLDELEAAEKRIAELEAREVKPVAWRLINSPESSLSVTDNKHIADVWKRNGRDVQALFPVPSVDLVPVGTALSEGRQMSAHNKSMVVDVMVESGKLTPGDKLYIAAAAGKGE
ncbi:ead/Ea22-like family protein [Citrobacter freundii]